MTTNDSSDSNPVNRYLHDYMLFLDGEAEKPSIDRLPPEARAEALERLRIVQPAPPVRPGARSRIAERLGFDRMGTTIAIDGAKLKAARQRQGLQLKEVATAITAAGAPIRTADLLHVEKERDARLDQTVVTRLVAVLGMSVGDIEAGFEAEVTELRGLLSLPRIEKVIAAWARDFDQDVSTVRDTVHQRVLAAKFRAEAVNEDQLVDIVRAILKRMER